MSQIGFMSDRLLNTPNEVYWFAAKLRCKVCRGELVVDAHCYPSGVSDTNSHKWHMTFLSCNHHYDLDVHWSDPKQKIVVCREGLILDINDVEYEVAISWIDDAVNADLTTDGKTIKVPRDWFDFDHFSQEEFATKINAILLLR